MPFKARTALGLASYRLEKDKVIVSLFGEDFMILHPEFFVDPKDSKAESHEQIRILIKEAVDEYLAKKD